MKTCLMFSPNDLDGVSIYRHWGPMLDLEKQGHVKLIAMPESSLQLTNWQYYEKCDFAFISRPAKNRDYYFIKECEKYGLPIWVDVDDNIFCVTDDNQAYDYYSSEESQKFALFGLKSAKILTVATNRLRSFLKENFALDSTLIPNAIHDRFWKMRRRINYNNNKILWRGSASKMADLLYFERELIQLNIMHSEREWHFMGLNPYFISRKIKDHKIKQYKAQNYIDYMHEIINLNPSHSFVAMIDSEFNRTRSSNAWVESTLAGAVTLAPSWPEWQRPGIFNYSGSRESFSDTFKEFLNLKPSDISTLHEQSLEQIKNNYLLSITNQLRLDIINKLMN